MKAFKDRDGREWKLSLNVTSVKRVRDLLKIDLLRIDEAMLETLATDEVALVNVVYALVKPEADGRSPGVSDEDFGRAMAGDAIDEAWKALLEELADFFRNPRKRELVRKALAKLSELEEKIIAHGERMIDSGAMERRLEKELEKIEAEAAGRTPTAGG